MKTNVDSLKTLYVKTLGGQLTDSYPDIAGGIPVGDYRLISDCILACAEKKPSGGGAQFFDVVWTSEQAGWTVLDTAKSNMTNVEFVEHLMNGEIPRITLQVKRPSQDNYVSKTVFVLSISETFQSVDIIPDMVIGKLYCYRASWDTISSTDTRIIFTANTVGTT